MGQPGAVGLQEGLRVPASGHSPAASLRQVRGCFLGVGGLPLAHILQSHPWGPAKVERSKAGSVSWVGWRKRDGKEKPGCSQTIQEGV